MIAMVSDFSWKEWSVLNVPMTHLTRAGSVTYNGATWSFVTD
jgi:hypothetical protein